MRVNNDIQHQQQLKHQQHLPSKQKPLVASIMHVTPPENNSCAVSSEDEDSDHINVDKLKTIRNKAAQK